MTPLWIALFGMAGVMARYVIGTLAAPVFDQSLPLSTFCINVLGSFLAAAVYVLGVERSVIAESLRTAIAVGFLGGFTTFSAFSLDVVKLIDADRMLYGFAYMVGSAVCAIAAAFAGLIVFRWLVS